MFTRTQAVEVPWLPGVLLGSLSLAASLLTMVLPETVNRPLPQTIDDIEQWYKRPTAKNESVADDDNQQEMTAINKQPTNSDVNA